jgi:hypothetical protein
MFPRDLEKELEIALDIAATEGGVETVLALGMPGIGKTEIPKAVAERLKIGFKRLVVPQYDEVDFRGVPEVNERKRTVFYPTEELPHADRDGERGILMADELPSGKPGVQVIWHQLMDSGTLGTLYKLPPGWIIMATGNRDEDGAFVHTLPSTVRRRTAVYTLEPNFEDWKRWALDSQQIEPEILSFLNKNPNEFIVFDPDKPCTNYALPSTWHKLARFVRGLKRRGEAPGLEGILARVGEAAGSKFHGWYKIWKEVPDIDAILAGTEKTIPAKMDIQWCVVSSITTKLIGLEKDKALMPSAKNALAYINLMTSDIVMAFLNDIMNTKFWAAQKKNIVKTPEFASLTKKHAKNIVGDVDL